MWVFSTNPINTDLASKFPEEFTFEAVIDGEDLTIKATLSSRDETVTRYDLNSGSRHIVRALVSSNTKEFLGMTFQWGVYSEFERTHLVTCFKKGLNDRLGK